MDDKTHNEIQALITSLQEYLQSGLASSRALGNTIGPYEISAYVATWAFQFGGLAHELDEPTRKHLASIIGVAAGKVVAHLTGHPGADDVQLLPPPQLRD